MRNYSINWGKFLIIRWLSISWVFQAIHVLDKGEQFFRIIIELIPVMFIGLLVVFQYISWWSALILFVFIHTLFWLFNSTWLVGFREIYTRFKGKGLQSVIDYTDWASKYLKDCNNITVIAIYGSICRHMYHDRSDFDLRIVQSRGLIKTYLKMIVLRTVAIWKYRIPIDLKLVDSEDFLKNEMRVDEHPIIVFNRNDFFYDLSGDKYDYLKANVDKYLKSNNLN